LNILDTIQREVDQNDHDLIREQFDLLTRATVQSILVQNHHSAIFESMKVFRSISNHKECFEAKSSQSQTFVIEPEVIDQAILTI